MVLNFLDPGLETSPAPARIPGRWLSLVRLFFLAQIIEHIVPVAWSLPAFYRKLLALEPGMNFPGWTAQELQTMVKTLGISPHLLGASLFFTALGCLLSYWVIALLLLWRSGNTWVGLLSAYVLSGVGVGFSYFILETASLPAWFQPFYSLSAALIWPTFFMILFLFPDGRFVPRWTGFLAPAPYALFLAATWIGDANTPAWMIGVVFAILLGGIASQVYRYRRVSGPDQRQQTKWVVFALTTMACLIITSFVPGLDVGTPARFYFDLIGNNYLSFLVAALLPISLIVAILRYHLWDIDVIIRRTLVYGALTVTLVLIYFGGATVLQALFSKITNQQSTISNVISTLLIAALFTPLRRRIQRDIDRRFYRRNYDAQKTLESFAARARDEVELDQLTTHLVAVVQETMQPERVSLWIAKPQRTTPP